MPQIRNPTLRALSKIGTLDKWRKEIAGIPTYFAAAMLAYRYAEFSLIFSFLIVICFMMIHVYVYEFFFPNFESDKKLGRLITFFAAQVAFWAAAFFLLFEVAA